MIGVNTEEYEASWKSILDYVLGMKEVFSW